MTICGTCTNLVAKLHSRVGFRTTRVHNHKNLIELLKSASCCELCSLIVTAPFHTQDSTPSSNPEERHFEPLCLNAFNRDQKLAVLAELFESDPEEFPPSEVEALEDIDTRFSEVRFCVTAFGGHLCGHVSLAVWKDSLCATDKAGCSRHDVSEEIRESIRKDAVTRELHRFQSCVSSDVAHRPQNMSFAHGSAAELDLLKSWILRCEDAHVECRYNIQGNRVYDDFLHLGPGLKPPTRILEIEGDTIKLVERIPGGLTLDGLGGFDEKDILQKRQPYVALSHCWGPEIHHPLKTTRSNLEQHIRGIPLSDLPLTFRDAAKIALHIGTNWLWIDSLCIIQDDEDGWRRESCQMDEIYQNAKLTIVAADASHSQEGCFVADRPDLQKLYELIDSAEDPVRCRPPDPPQVSIVSPGVNGLPVTIIFAPVPKLSPNPYFSPLALRGWAMQEWYLSRKACFFTRSGLSWKCRAIQFNEREQYMDMHEKLEWEHLLKRYSETQLTRETDRLIALQGIVNASSANMSGTCHFGTWTHLPELLLWSMSKPEYDVQGVNAPSWSWASRNGPKIFYATMLPFNLGIVRSDFVMRHVSIDQLGTWTMLAAVLEVHCTAAPREQTQWRIFTEKYFPDGPGYSPEAALFHTSHMAGLPVLYLRLSGDSPDVAIGLSSCDDGGFLLDNHRLFCVLIAMPKKVSICQGANEPSDSCVHYDGNDDKRMAYFLLVTPVDGKVDCYRRVGMGMMNASKLRGREVIKKIEIM